METMEKTASGRHPKKILMEKTAIGRLPKEILMVNILSGLPLKTIARFKSVSKPWKSLIESPLFRRLFVSLHEKSSLSWSLMLATAHLSPTITEALGFHGCQTWDLPKSPGSFLMPDPNLPTFYRGSSNGLILIEIGHDYKSLVGNPVLQQWVEIPPPPEPCTCTGLVTRVKEDGLVSSFKVVRTCQSCDTYVNEWRVFVYSSESGLWSYKRLSSLYPIHIPSSCSSMSLSEKLYLLETRLDPARPDLLIAYDFYFNQEAEADECQVISLPLANHRRCLTSSRGHVFLIELVGRRLTMWKLGNYDSEWQMFRIIHILSVGFIKQCFPLAMNPFDPEIVYLWSLQHGCFVSGDLFVNRFKVHQESENWNWRSSSEGCCRLNTHDSKGYMKGMYDAANVIMLSQFVLPQWMCSVPTIGLN